jgi:hypothetical protein
MVRAPGLSARDLRKHLRSLTATVTKACAAIDAEMALPASAKRGRRIAEITNALEFANDIARHFALGVHLKTKNKPRAVPR